MTAQPAGAFAWKSTCNTYFYNGLGSDGYVKLSGWIPTNPELTSPDVAYALAIYGTVGVAPNQQGFVQEVGFPITDGCHGVLVFGTSRGSETCTYSDPSSGRNSFNCSGDADPYTHLQWIDDGDTMTVRVNFGSICSCAADAAARAAVVKPPPPPSRPTEDGLARKTALRRSDLAGHGWQPTKKLRGSLLHLARLLAAGNAPGCTGSKPNGPPIAGVAATLYGTSAGGQYASSLAVYYKRRRAAAATFANLASPHTRGCLVALTRGGKRIHARTAVTILSTSGLPGGSVRYRVTIAYSRGPAGYLDFAGIRGRHGWAALAFYREGRPVADTTSVDAMLKVAARLR